MNTSSWSLSRYGTIDDVGRLILGNWIYAYEDPRGGRDAIAVEWVGGQVV